MLSRGDILCTSSAMARRVGNNGTETEPVSNRYWISFDLGLMGNYSGVYEWLDSHGAKECGPGLATIKSAKTRDQLATEIQRILKGVPRARAYVISMKQGGRFVAGARKASPWEGFAASHAKVEDED